MYILHCEKLISSVEASKMYTYLHRIAVMGILNQTSKEYLGVQPYSASVIIVIFFIVTELHIFSSALFPRLPFCFTPLVGKSAAEEQDVNLAVIFFTAYSSIFLRIFINYIVECSSLYREDGSC